MYRPREDSEEARPDVQVVPLEETDLDQVLAVEKLSYAAPWSLNCFRGELSRPYSHLLGAVREAEGRREVLGYSCFWILYNEMHLLNLSVHPRERGKGLGRLLLARTIEVGRLQEVTLVTLEVRVTNEVAINLYRSFGFRPVGIRPRYYSPEREDALLMQLTLV